MVNFFDLLDSELNNLDSSVETENIIKTPVDNSDGICSSQAQSIVSLVDSIKSEQINQVKMSEPDMKHFDAMELQKSVIGK